ncbi:hypothetical protein BJ742DRAFT_560962 [Cladochytrium replicatum]|nr:hypothetical protein BJ742DRAFT_560962 [Cladochytrium replicatum]
MRDTRLLAILERQRRIFNTLSKMFPPPPDPKAKPPVMVDAEVTCTLSGRTLVEVERAAMERARKAWEHMQKMQQEGKDLTSAVLSGLQQADESGTHRARDRADSRTLNRDRLIVGGLGGLGATFAINGRSMTNIHAAVQGDASPHTAPQMLRRPSMSRALPPSTHSRSAFDLSAVRRKSVVDPFDPPDTSTPRVEVTPAVWSSTSVATSSSKLVSSDPDSESTDVSLSKLKVAAAQSERQDSIIRARRASIALAPDIPVFLLVTNAEMSEYPSTMTLSTSSVQTEDQKVTPLGASVATAVEDAGVTIVVGHNASVDEVTQEDSTEASQSGSQRYSIVETSQESGKSTKRKGKNLVLR